MKDLFSFALTKTHTTFKPSFFHWPPEVWGKLPEWKVELVLFFQSSFVKAIPSSFLENDANESEKQSITPYKRVKYVPLLLRT